MVVGKCINFAFSNSQTPSRIMKKPISSAVVFRQLLADLTGKDAYRGITFTYTWMANQFGHFSLGFFLALCLSYVFQHHFHLSAYSLSGAIFSSLFWLMFETVNFLVPLLLFRKSSINNTSLTFHPPWFNIAFDTFTDICFFAIGSFSAGIYVDFNWFCITILLILVILIIYPTYYWYLSKMYVQNANYPFQMRFSQWKGMLSDADKKTTIEFLLQPTNGKHLFIFGERNTGKTSLAVGIATELSNNHKTCSYSTAIKLFTLFSLTEDELKEDKNNLWTFRSSELLVIDDINPSDPLTPKFITPAIFQSLITATEEIKRHNQHTFCHNNAIWVLGMDWENRQLWAEMLVNMGVKQHNISFIQLEKTIL
jgi:hypothetical protein